MMQPSARLDITELLKDEELERRFGNNGVDHVCHMELSGVLEVCPSQATWIIGRGQ